MLIARFVFPLAFKPFIPLLLFINNVTNPNVNLQFGFPRPGLNGKNLSQPKEAYISGAFVDRININDIVARFWSDVCEMVLHGF
jgi:hypothetical protein